MRSFPALLALAALALPALARAEPPADPARKAADGYVAGRQKAILSDFSGLLALPNVATKVADVERNAAAVSSLLQQRGFATRLLSAGAGTPPTVYGELKVPGATRTVLFYAHYDGQPVGQKNWLSEPFQPVVRTGPPGPDARLVDWRAAPRLDPDWRLYARSAGDDKGSIQALLTAMDALKAAGLKLSVNVKIFYEGEEEQGSPHLDALIRDNAALLASDLIIMGDGPMHQSGKQMINFGNRGLVGLTLTVFGPLRPLHDGHYGGWVPSPAVEMATLIAGLRREDGEVLIKGFYDDVVPPTPAEQAALAALPPVEAPLKRELGIAASATPARLADSYFRPTLNVRSIHVGDAGEHAANAVPISAFASIDFRLTPGETPQRVRRLLEEHLRAQGWFLVEGPPDLATRLAHPKLIQLAWDAGSAVAVKSDLSAPASIAVADAISRVEGYPVLKLPMVGASSGLAVIVQGLRAPMVGVSIANADDNQHAENENLKLGALWDGVAVYAALLSELRW